ncbi:MAG: hypothetical protein RMJ33_12450 [Saprospiraceae bacterium]|nr:hypothetical protein [Saprospiraceae bacterium]MDW8230638.1 hypothetical protein [Saprospiraceae bacterium]
MRSAVVIGLIGIMLAQAWVRTAWVLDYQWRRAAYLKACENKARPQLKCDGKCYLLKQIKRSETRNDTYPPLPESLREMKEITLFAEDLWAWLVSAFIEERHRREWLYRVPLLVSEKESIFHPPEG